MIGSLGGMELALIALVVVLLFGVGKFSNLGKDLGSSIKEFRRAVKDEDEKPPETPQVQQSTQYTPPAQPPQQQYTAPPQQQQAPPPPPQSSENKNPNVF